MTCRPAPALPTNKPLHKPLGDQQRGPIGFLLAKYTKIFPTHKFLLLSSVVLLAAVHPTGAESGTASGRYPTGNYRDHNQPNFASAAASPPIGPTAANFVRPVLSLFKSTLKRRDQLSWKLVAPKRKKWGLALSLPLGRQLKLASVIGFNFKKGRTKWRRKLCGGADAPTQSLPLCQNLNSMGKNGLELKKKWWMEVNIKVDFGNI